MPSERKCERCGTLLDWMDLIFKGPKGLEEESNPEQTENDLCIHCRNQKTLRRRDHSIAEVLSVQDHKKEEGS